MALKSFLLLVTILLVTTEFVYADVPVTGTYPPKAPLAPVPPVKPPTPVTKPPTPVIKPPVPAPVYKPPVIVPPPVLKPPTPVAPPVVKPPTPVSPPAYKPPVSAPPPVSVNHCVQLGVQHIQGQILAKGHAKHVVTDADVFHQARTATGKNVVSAMLI
ncbi:hypothetical protein F8388_025459 [Cannabis sativa]|uniref:Uncharacterized protein n=1 Tax=Cannabis sativa TaxID=3483 RepID=A0A7J6G0X2_CANSA|nr:hypothetical protein F8388_025459 [Cannabis sativa]